MFGWGFGFENAFTKIKYYWQGIKDRPIPNGGTWGAIAVGRIPVENNFVKVRLKYRNNDLADAYKNPGSLIVTHWRWDNDPDPPMPPRYWGTAGPDFTYVNFLMLNCGLTQDQAEKQEKNVIWEIVGRMCHLIQDMGVPAHTHNAAHPFTEAYELDYLPASFDWYNATNVGSSINLFTDPNNNTIQNPLRYIMYTANQLGDAFASNFYVPFSTGNICGDRGYSRYYQEIGWQNPDDYYPIIQPVYDYLNNQGNNVPICVDGDFTESYCRYILDNSYTYSIRATAGFLWWIYNKFDLQPLPEIEISEPRNCWGIWNPIIVVPGMASFPCRFIIKGENQQFFIYSVFYKQGEQIINTFHHGVAQANTVINVECPLDVPGLCYNNPYELVIKAWPDGHPNDDAVGITTFILYNPTSNCMWPNHTALTNMDNFLVENKNVTFNAYGGWCNGTFLAKRYKVYKQINYTDQQTIVKNFQGGLDASNTAGFNYNEQNSSTGIKWAGIQNQTPTSAILYTYVYEIPSKPENERWAPCSPQNAASYMI